MQAHEWTPTISAAGHLPGQVRREFDDVVRSLAGKRITIKLSMYRKPRSGQQNRFYHGPFIESIRDHLLECGQRLSPDDIHESLRDAHAKNGYTIWLPGDVPFKVAPSTRRLDTMGFEAYLEEIRAEFAQRVGWQLPFPNESFDQPIEEQSHDG